MLNVIFLLLSPIVPALIYRYIRKHDVSPDKLPSGDFVRSALTGGWLATLLIILLEIAWDAIFKPADPDTLGYGLLSSFLRAALIEETFKMIFAVRVLKRRGAVRRIDFILLAGTVGIFFGIIEKAVLMNPVPLILDTLLPFHMLFQFLTGDMLWRAYKATDPSKKRLLKIGAFALPFVLHGTWDALLSVMKYLLDRGEGSPAETIGTIGVILLVASGVLVTILAIGRTAGIAGENEK